MIRRLPGFMLDVFVIWASGAWFDGAAWRFAWRELTWEPEAVTLPSARVLRAGLTTEVAHEP